MNLRIVLLGLVWFGVMLLIFATPAESQTVYFDWLPSRSIIHGILFVGFVHIWIGTLKKQLKYDVLRKHASIIVFISALGIALLSEILIFWFNLSPTLNYYNLVFDLIGSCFGLLTFHLVYETSN